MIRSTMTSFVLLVQMVLLTGRLVFASSYTEGMNNPIEIIIEIGGFKNFTKFNKFTKIWYIYLREHEFTIE